MDKAAFVISQEKLRLTDTRGIVVYEVDMGPVGETGESRREVAERLVRQRTECLDCGAKVPSGAVYCTVDAPYGFWHWLKFFSAVRWAR